MAFTPSTPLHTKIEDSAWSLAPAEEAADSTPQDHGQPAHWVRLAPKSLACIAFLKAFAALEQNRHSSHVPKTTEIKIMASAPVNLDTIYVTVEKGLLEKVDAVQNKLVEASRTRRRREELESRLHRDLKSA